MSLRREDVLREIASDREWDIVIIGGGATGLGAAVDAASRGYKTLLLEAHDFAKGTSSRSTKLVHGGVRYLQQGNVKLVLEALRERGRLLRNAPHLAHRMSFVIPAYSWWEIPFYGIGLTLYDLLAGREGLGHSRILSSSKTEAELPTVRRADLKGGIRYYDGQFDDARLAITLLRTVFDLGGTALNYCPAKALLKTGGRISGVLAEDSETSAHIEVAAKVVINATGVFADDIRRMDEPGTSTVVTASQGSHIVLDRYFLSGESGMMIPRTSDGRVLFAIPWHSCVVVGTTDDAVPKPDIEPQPGDAELQFLTAHVERFLGRRPEAGEILSIWSGQRPLVRHEGVSTTAAISRDHTIFISESKLITIVGGKWTTYRRMGEDVIDRAAALCGLNQVTSRTAELRLHGAMDRPSSRSEWQEVYGADLTLIDEMVQAEPDLGQPLHPLLPFRQVEVVWAARHEMARRLEDVLARRTRALFLNAKASVLAAPSAAKLLAREIGRDEGWQQEQISQYQKLAEQYMYKQ
jgi:glycerol-3-phosphate dehydrogenase